MYVIGPVQTSADREVDSPSFDGRAAYMAACSSYTAGKARASRVGPRDPYGLSVSSNPPRRVREYVAKLYLLCSPSPRTSMPSSACLRTTSTTDSRTRREY